MGITGRNPHAVLQRRDAKLFPIIVLVKTSGQLVFLFLI